MKEYKLIKVVKRNLAKIKSVIFSNENSIKSTCSVEENVPKKKYELTAEKIEYGIFKLYRIRALTSFGSVKAGDLGGYIEKEENLSQEGDAWVGDNARVFDNAYIFDNAQVYGDATVCGDASVGGNAQVYDHASVFKHTYVAGNARVCGNATVCDNAFVTDNAYVYGNANISDKACISENASVYGDSQVYGNSYVHGNAHVYGNAQLDYYTHVCANAEIRNKYDFFNLNLRDLPFFRRITFSGTFFRCKDHKIGINSRFFSGSLEGFRDEIEKTYKDSKTAQEFLLLADLAELYFDKEEENDIKPGKIAMYECKFNNDKADTIAFYRNEDGSYKRVVKKATVGGHAMGFASTVTVGNIILEMKEVREKIEKQVNGRYKILQDLE